MLLCTLEVPSYNISYVTIERTAAANGVKPSIIASIKALLRTRRFSSEPKLGNDHTYGHAGCILVGEGCSSLFHKPWWLMNTSLHLGKQDSKF